MITQCPAGTHAWKRAVLGSLKDRLRAGRDAETIDRVLADFQCVNNIVIARFLDDRIIDMAALPMLRGSKPAGSSSTLGRARRDGGQPRVPARARTGAAPDEATKALIHR